MQDNENKEIIEKLLKKFILYMIGAGFLITIIFSIILKRVSNIVLIATIMIIIHGIMMFISWKISIEKTLQTRISISQFDSIMKCIILATLVIYVIGTIAYVSNMKRAINETKLEIAILETLRNNKNNKEPIYNFKEGVIEQAIQKMNVSITFQQVGIFVAYIWAIERQRKKLLEYVKKE